MEVRSEAELQRFLTVAFRSREVLESTGLWGYGAMGYEAKLVKGRRLMKAEPPGFTGSRRIVEVVGKGQMMGSGVAVPSWRASGSRLGLSKIKKKQRTSTMRAGYGGEGGRKPLSYKISDSAIGFKPFDGFAMWQAWSGYAFGWSDVWSGTRCYLIRAEAFEAWAFELQRGGLSEVEAWAMCDACLVWK